MWETEREERKRDKVRKESRERGGVVLSRGNIYISIKQGRKGRRVK